MPLLVVYCVPRDAIVVGQHSVMETTGMTAEGAFHDGKTLLPQPVAQKKCLNSVATARFDRESLISMS